ncbi:MAG: hypothetical protein N2043_09755, partial [Ignavibacterium sp.]|nr:hypothetical protein [Ignavibacterium sp.]
MKKQLDKIINDSESGSNQILLNLIEYCKKYYDNSEELKLIIKKSEESLSHFATIKQFIKKLKKKLNESTYEDLLIFLNDYKTKNLDSIISIYNTNKDLFSQIKSFTTISFSKTILDVVKIVAKEKKKLKVFVLESRPVFEGRKLASELCKINVDVTLIVDALMCYAVKNSDTVLVGADQILKNGNVVNKIGSYPLAICAKKFNKPFYVIADKSKFVNKTKFFPNSSPENEIWKTRNRVKIINHYFEE